MKLHKTDLFSPIMIEFELCDHYLSDKYTMTSSVKIFKISMFRCMSSFDKNFRPELFYNDFRLIGFDLMYHMTISDIRGQNWSF